MTCASCVARVEDALRQVEGVVEASVNLATSSAEVATRARVPDAKLIESVRRLGFSARIANASTRSEGLSRALVEATSQRRRHRHAFAWAAGGWLVLAAMHHVLPLDHHSWIVGAISAAVASAMLASPAGRGLLISGVRTLWHRAPNMDALVTMGVSAAYLASMASLLQGGHGPQYFEPLGMILLFIQGGRYAESRARHEAGRAVAELVGEIPPIAVCQRDGEWVTVPVGEVHLGDRVRVVPDGVIPVDGRILEGEAAVDESSLTGESVPRARQAGDEVWGGTMVREGTIILSATGVGADTAIGRIVTAVERAQAGKTNMQRIADRVAAIFVPIVLLLAVATAAGWMLLPPMWGGASAGWNWALGCAVAVLVIACPCAMGLATPMAVLVATGRAARHGILIRNPAALEAVGQATVVVFDKTGTVTTGQPTIEDVYFEPRAAALYRPNEILCYAASAEQFSTHPLAKAVVKQAAVWRLALEDPSGFETFAGRGVRATIKGHDVLVGSPALLAERGVNIEPLRSQVRHWAAQGWTVIAIAVEGAPAGLIALADTVREHASATMDALAEAHCKVELLTGDSAATAQMVAAQVGIRDVSAEMRPEDKLAAVRRLQEAGEIVAFVGDGTNDAPGLAAADAGIAFAAGTAVANEAAEMTLVGSDLRAVATAITLARRSVAVIRQNLFWAFFYNLLALPLAALGIIPPGWAAAAMMLSSLTVVLNSLRLRRE